MGCFKVFLMSGLGWLHGFSQEWPVMSRLVMGTSDQVSSW